MLFLCWFLHYTVVIPAPYRYLAVLFAVVLAVPAGVPGAAPTGQAGADAAAVPPEFASSALTQQRGDVVRIGVRMTEGGSADIDVIGRQSDYEAHLTVEDDNDDGRVIVTFNTYLAGADAAFGTLAAGDAAQVKGQASVDGVLPAGGYRLLTADTDEGADLTIEPRGTTSLDVMLAPAPAADRLVDEDAVERYRAAENLTVRTDGGTAPVATGDTLVVRIRATGLAGALAAQSGTNDTERFRSLVAGDDVSIDVTQTNPTVEREPATVLVDWPGVELVADPRDDAYYLVVDTERAHYRRGAGGPIEQGLPMAARFAANLTVAADGALASDTDERVGDAFRVVERSASPRVHTEAGDPFLYPDGGQHVNGTTTLAPGSAVTVRVAGPDGFERTAATTVGPAGELGRFETTVDLSALGEGATVDVVVREDRGPLTSEALTVTVRSPAAAMDLDGLRTETGTAYVDLEVRFSRGGLVTVHPTGDPDRVLGTAPVAPGSENVSVALSDLPPVGTQLVVTAVRDLDDDGRFTPGVDVPYEEPDSPRPLTTFVLLNERPPSPTPTATPATPTTGTATVTATPWTPGTPTLTGTPPTEGRSPTRTSTPGDLRSVVEEVPGSGVAPALAALLAALVLVRRRGPT